MLRLCKDCMHLMSRADVERRGERCRLPASMAVLSGHYNRLAQSIF